VSAALALAALVTAVASASAQAPAPAPTAAEAAIVAVKLQNNTLIIGKVVSETDDTLVFDAGPLGQVTLKKSDIAQQLDAAALAALTTPPPAGPPPPPGIGGFAPMGHVVWTRNADFGGTFNSAAFEQGQLDPKYPGVTGALLRLPGNQYSVQSQITLMRSDNLRAAFLNASLAYAVYQPFGPQTNVPTVSLGYNFRQRDGQRFFALTRYTWYRDPVRHVTYSNQAFAGIGIQAVDRKIFKMGIVPVVGVIREEKGIPQFDNRTLLGWGGLVQIGITPTPTMQIEARELFHQAFSDAEFRGVESYAGFKSMFSRHVGLQAGVTVKYDNVIAQSITIVPPSPISPVPIPFFANLSTVVLTTVGVHLEF